MYLNKIKVQKQIKLFKKRKKQKVIYKDFIFSPAIKKSTPSWSYVFSRFLLFFELRFYKFFFLKLRRLSKKKKFKAYVHVSCNHFFSKKSKNSRMGKGKGKFVRYVYRTKVMLPNFVFYRISKNRVSSFVLFLNKKTKNKFWYFFC